MRKTFLGEPLDDRGRRPVLSLFPAAARGESEFPDDVCPISCPGRFSFPVPLCVSVPLWLNLPLCG